MTKSFQSIFLPIAVIGVLLVVSFRGGSISGFIGAVLPFVILVAFWSFLKATVSRRKRAEQPPTAANQTATTSARDLAQPTDISALSKKVGLSD